MAEHLEGRRDRAAEGEDGIMKKLTIGKGARRRTVGYIVLKNGSPTLCEGFPRAAGEVLVRDETRTELFLSRAEANRHIRASLAYVKREGLHWEGDYAVIQLVTT
jgi:hypothetical protein